MIFRSEWETFEEIITECYIVETRRQRMGVEDGIHIDSDSNA